MNKAIETEIKGIQCDNPDCDYIDHDIEFVPEKYLNKPCPKCGQALFTQDQWDQIKIIENRINIINNMIRDSGIKIPDYADREYVQFTHDHNGMIKGIKKVEK